MQADTSNFSLCTRDTITAIVIALVIFAVYTYFYKQKFTDVTPETNMAKQELAVPVAYSDLDTRSIMAGSGFIPAEYIPPYGEVDELDDGAGGNMGLHYNMCSPSCCSAQYPTPHKLPYDQKLCGSKDLVPSSYMCNNAWNNSGCLCLRGQDQGKFLYSRGGNAGQPA